MNNKIDIDGLIQTIITESGNRTEKLKETQKKLISVAENLEKDQIVDNETRKDLAVVTEEGFSNSVDSEKLDYSDSESSISLTSQISWASSITTLSGSPESYYGDYYDNEAKRIEDLEEMLREYERLFKNREEKKKIEFWRIINFYKYSIFSYLVLFLALFYKSIY